MEPERNITPEKQLLKLIEDPNANDPKSLKARKIKRSGFSWLSWGALKGRFSFARSHSGRWIQSARALVLDIRWINAFLLVLAVLIGFFLLTGFFNSLAQLRKTPDFKTSINTNVSGAIGATQSSFDMPFSKILVKIRARDIFKMKEEVRASKTVESSAPEVDPRAEIIEATKHLRLVGISWSDDPDAMIEDTKAARTFFVKQGEMIGRVRIEAIFRDKLILQYKGQEVELK